MPETRILLIGAGAIGALYASRLSTVPSVLVSCICRSNYQAVASKGFTVHSPTYGTTDWKPEHVFSSPSAARAAMQERAADREWEWDYVVVSTKALPDVADDAALLEGLVGAKTAIVLVQNGLGVEEPYVARFPRATVLSAVTIASASQPEHGVVKHNRWSRISVGPYLGHLDGGGKGRAEDEEAGRRCEEFVGLLKGGGVRDAEVYDHAGLQWVRWHKIAINAAMNPSSVLAGNAANQNMALDPLVSEHLLGVMKEVLAAAPVVLGKSMPSSLASAERILESTKKNTSGSRPSMSLDWQAGRPLEIEVILGNPIRIAERFGVEMPRLKSMYALLKMAQKLRDEEAKRRKEREGSKM